jgi:hypothetical protein
MGHGNEMFYFQCSWISSSQVTYFCYWKLFECRKVLLQVILFRWRHFALPWMSLIFLRCWTFSEEFHLLFIDSPESCSCFYYDNGFIITIGFFSCKKKYDLPSILLRILKPLHLNYVLKIVLFVKKEDDKWNSWLFFANFIPSFEVETFPLCRIFSFTDHIVWEGTLNVHNV